MRRRAWLLAAALVAIAVSLPAGGVASAAPDAERPAYSKTKVLTRSLTFEGQHFDVDSREVTVSVDRTTQLRGRERIKVSWSGAHPTGGRAASPFGENGILQEYPVVILQCRGLDDASLPPEEQVRPETCWTTSRAQRSLLVDESQAVWRHDASASEEQRGPKTGLVPIPAECSDVEFFSTHITPFVASNGTVYPGCTSETMPPEAAVGAAFPPADMAAYSDLDGNGSVLFEVRSNVENESLGCSDTVPCSLVVIPIMGINCLSDNAECSKAGQFEPGSSNFGNVGVDLAVSPQLWWAPSNWQRRFSVPIEFGLPPDACNVLDSRAPTGFYGSELMAQASLQWSPAYCLDKKRFKFQHNKMADAAAFTLMETGGGAAAFVSGPHASRGKDPVAYAPTAATGFGIGYVIDRPDNGGEFTKLRLSARLLAKLITQSYLGSDRGRGHPGMGENPLSINQDPEFQKLNPGLSTGASEAAAVMLSLSEASDVITVLTDYIAHDDDAMAFVNGKPDEWGMVVNPSYKKISLPRDEWPLLDDYVPVTTNECYSQNPAPYFTQLAAPIASLRKVAEAVLDAWPNVQTKCDRATIDSPWRVGRLDRQGVGARFMLGIVSLGDAQRFGVRVASLETARGEYVAPTDSSLRKALAVATPSKGGVKPFDLDLADVVKAKSAYPGTMIVYTAARTANLVKSDADKVAEFIRVATTEGQQTGHGNGELPPGYVPLQKTGVTAPLWKQAQVVASAIAEQKGATDSGGGNGSEGGDSGSGDGSGTGTHGGDGLGPGSVTSVDGTDEEPTTSEGTGEGTGKDKDKDKGKGKGGDEDESEDQELVAMPPTTEVSSPVAESALPLLLLITLISAVAANLIRLRHLRRRRA